jgi:hypothetical protein
MRDAPPEEIMRHFASRYSSYVLLAMAVGWSPARAHADPILLDQQNVGTRTGGFGLSGTTTIAQTFSVGTSGILRQLDLSVFNPNPGSTAFPDSLTIGINRTSAARPGNTVLQSMTVPLADVTTDRFSLSSLPGWNVDVQAGDVLAIVLSTGALGNYGWSTSCCYSGGDMFLSNGSGFTPIFPNTSGVPADFMFRTFVESSDPSVSATPEPASLLLLASGLTAAFVRRVRHRSSPQ